MDSKRRVIVYTILVFAISSVFYYLAIKRPNFPQLFFWLMWCPAVASFVTTVITRRAWREYGWRIGPVSYLAKGYYFPLLYAAPAYVIVWLAHLGGFPNPSAIDSIRKFLHAPDLSAGVTALVCFGLVGLVNVPFSLVSAVGEEIGWRGFLVPELTKWLGIRKAAIVSGVIWTIWHIPLIVAGPYSNPDTPRAYQVLCFSLMLVSTGVAFAWLRIKSGSLWPAAIFHASHNAFIQGYFDSMTLNTGHTNYFTSEFGIAMVPFSILLAMYCWRRIAEEPKLAATSAKA